MEKKKFPWGDVKKRHYIGPHLITEFICEDSDVEDAGKTMFSYEAGLFYTIEEAMLGVVCNKYEPHDHNLYGYVARLIGIPEND